MTLIALAQSPHLRRRLRLPGAVPTIDAEDWRGFTDRQRRNLLKFGIVPPMAGADDGDGDGGDGGGDGGDGGDGDGDGDGGSDGGDGDGDGGGDGGDGGDGDGDDEAAKAKAEAARQKRRADEAEKKARRLEREKQERERSKSEEDGEFEKLYNEEKEAHSKTVGKVKGSLLKAEVIRIAAAQKFLSPELAPDLVKLNKDDVVDDDFDIDSKPIERALKDIAKKHKHLVDPDARQSRRTGEGDRELGGNGNGGRRRGREDDDEDRSGEQPIRPRDRLRTAYATTE